VQQLRQLRGGGAAVAARFNAREYRLLLAGHIRNRHRYCLQFENENHFQIIQIYIRLSRGERRGRKKRAKFLLSRIVSQKKLFDAKTMFVKRVKVGGMPQKNKKWHKFKKQ
jgi:hypothetical protein